MPQRVSATMQLPLQLARNVQPLRVVPETADLELASVRAQRKTAAVAVDDDLRPATGELVAPRSAPLEELHFHPSAGYGNALVVPGVTIDVAERQIQYEHFEPGKRQDQPRPQCGECDRDADRDDEDKREDEQPAGGTERIIAPRNEREPRRPLDLHVLRPCGHYLQAPATRS